MQPPLWYPPLVWLQLAWSLMGVGWVGFGSLEQGNARENLIREMKLSFAIKLTNGVDCDVREGRQMRVSKEQDVGDVSTDGKSHETREEASKICCKAEGPLVLNAVSNPGRLQLVINLLAVLGINHQAWSPSDQLHPPFKWNTCLNKKKKPKTPSSSTLAWPLFAYATAIAHIDPRSTLELRQAARTAKPSVTPA